MLANFRTGALARRSICAAVKQSTNSGLSTAACVPVAIDAPRQVRPRLPDSAVTAPTTPVVSATYCTVLSLSSPLIVGIHCGLSGMEEYNFDASLRASCTESVWDDGAGRRSKISRRCCYAVPALAVSGAAGIKYRLAHFHKESLWRGQPAIEAKQVLHHDDANMHPILFTVACSLVTLYIYLQPLKEPVARCTTCTALAAWFFW